VLRYAWPLTLQPVSRPKLGIVFVAQNAERLSAAINSWLSARSLDVDWVVMIVGTNARHSARDMASSLTIEHEVHLVEQGKTLGDRLACAKDLAIRIEVKAMLTVTDAVRFGQFGWESHVFSQPQNAGSVWALTAEGRGETLLEVSYGDADGTVSARVEIFGLIEGLPVPGLERVLTVDPKISPTRRALSPTPVAEQAGVQVISEGQGHAVRPGRTVNEIFERVQVLNLDRRPDRWEEMKWQLDNAGIAAERFGAVDGSLPEIGAEFEEYASQPLVPFPVHVEHLDFGIDFYIHPPCQVARVAQLEQRSVSKAIASAGAWGYMRSYRTILEQSLADQVETLLVFDDDVLFHRDFEALFAQVAEELPEDWLVLQLGTLQYNWEQPWFDPVSNHLYRTNGAAIGSHAVGMRFEAIPSILDHVSRMDMPFDIGAMSAFTQAFPEQCFIALPNLAIQRLGRKSDINTSEFQKASTIEETAATYRWNLADYPDGECASADLGMGHDRKAGT